MAKKKLNNQTDGRRAYSAAVDSMYSNSPSGSTRSRTAAKRVEKEYDDKYEAELRKLRKKYATPYRGNEVTGFGTTAYKRPVTKAGGPLDRKVKVSYAYEKRDQKGGFGQTAPKKSSSRRPNPKKK